jgi:hypothetical protein
VPIIISAIAAAAAHCRFCCDKADVSKDGGEHLAAQAAYVASGQHARQRRAVSRVRDEHAQVCLRGRVAGWKHNAQRRRRGGAVLRGGRERRRGQEGRRRLEAELDALRAVAVAVHVAVVQQVAERDHRLARVTNRLVAQRVLVRG